MAFIEKNTVTSSPEAAATEATMAAICSFSRESDTHTKIFLDSFSIRAASVIASSNPSRSEGCPELPFLSHHELQCLVAQGQVGDGHLQALVLFLSCLLQVALRTLPLLSAGAGLRFRAPASAGAR
jgi:hypothetical protein